MRAFVHAAAGRGAVILGARDIEYRYCMSEKAVGTDWMTKIRPTLRHAAGCAKFLKISK
jgi:hypothetical protein